jgi:simple sugar transport system permease protein
MTQDTIPMADESLKVRLAGALRSIAGAVVQPAITIIFALLMGVFVVVAIGQDPVAAYHAFLFGSFDNALDFGNLLAKATPLISTGICVMIAFRGGAFNVGGEGQMYLGAFWGAVAGLTFVDLPGPLLILVVIIVAAIAGGLWAAIAGVLKARWEVDEVVSTLLLNYVAMLLTQYLVDNVFKDVTAGAPMTTYIASQAWLPRILPPSAVTIGLLIALVIAVGAWFLMFRTVWGANVRSAGTNRRFAQAMGINVRRTLIQTMFISGAVAGIGGAIEVMGVEHRFYQGFSPGFGFLGLTAALLGRLNPWGTLAMAFLYAALLNGAAIMQIQTPVPNPLVNILSGIIVIVMTAQARPAIGKFLRRKGAPA